MATSQNGWFVFTSPPSGTIPGYITGRVRPEDVDTVFTYLCERIDREVENIRPEWSWGWAFRAIRGSSSGYSNHASGTAIDVNAPAHPLGVTGTWSLEERAKVHTIMRDMGNILRWGEDYVNRKDGMHFEINAGAAAVHTVAQRIRNRQLPDQRPDWKPKKAHAVHFGRVQEQFLIAAGAQEGEIRRRNGVGLVQQALNKALDRDLDVDGYVGKATLNAWGAWEDRVGGLGRRRVPDRKSIDELVDFAGLGLVGDPWNDDEPDEPTPSPDPDEPAPRKSRAEVAREIIDGKWGNGEERRKRLEAAGYNYDKVQAEVVKLLDS